MKFIRTSQLVVCSLITAALGCGGQEPPVRSTTETTSTTVSNVTPAQLNEAQQNAAQAERERDEARQLADIERTRRDRDVQAVKERADYAISVRKQLDATDAQLHTMLEKSVKSTAASRAHVDELMKKRDDVEQLLRKVQDESADAWDQFKIQVDMAVEDLKKDVSLPAQPQRKTTPDKSTNKMPATPARPTSPPSTQP